VTIFASSSSTRASRRPFASRSLALAGLLGALLAATLLGPATAGAVVTTVGGATVGLQPRDSQTVLDGLSGKLATNEVFTIFQGESFSNGAGNPVLHGSNAYAVYWDPTDTYHGDWQALIDGYLRKRRRR